MAHKERIVTTGGGYSVLNDGTVTEVISQAGAIIGDIQATAGSIGTAELADDAVTSDKLDATVLQYKEVALTAAEINALFTTSIEVIPAVTGKSIILDSFVLDLTGTATQFAAGGVVGLQYGDTANGAGTLLHADIAASVLTGATANIKTLRIPKDLSSIATASIDGIGVYIGAQTQDFTTGTGTAILKVSYHVV